MSSSDQGTIRAGARTLIAAAFAAACSLAFAQQPDKPAADKAAARPAAGARPGAATPWAGIGRPATAAEIKAWDIDVRADFHGLPPGSGTVAKGMDVWEAKCASCHGVFGESNEVFTPIAGGTTKEDMETGRVANLTRADFPQRTTLMKLSQVSTLWDYINRAMPWTAPKTLSVEEVYAVTAYILHLGDIVPADFTLTDKNIADVQKKLPNRHGMVFHEGLWRVDGKPDVVSKACMNDCETEVKVTSRLPDHARDAHGNLAAQHRVIGPVRGIDSTKPASADVAKVSVAAALASVGAGGAAAKGGATPAAGAAAAAGAAKPPAGGKPGATLAQDAGCMACHGIDKKIVGPGFKAVAERYEGDAGAVESLATKIRNGSAGVWGPVPMPAQGHVSEADAVSLVKWILNGHN